MKTRWMIGAVALVAVTALATTLAVTTIGASRAGQAKAPVPSRAEHITVVGEWTLEVRNPDGTTVLVRRFHNDPTQANQAIATILARAYTPGYFWIALSGPTEPCLSAGTPVQCLIIDSGDGGAYSASTNAFKTLATSHTSFQSSITLTGSITAQANGNIDTVATNLSVCNSSTAANVSCGTSAFWPFTSRTLASPISLVTGQQLLITVVLSFS